MNNYLITGPPRCGKTTLIMKIKQLAPLSARISGFITEEVRERGERIGFKLISLSEKKEGFLAKKDFPSPFRVGRYGVNIEDLDDIGCSAIEKGLQSGKVIFIDEIGKMELFSAKFRKILLDALDSPQKVLASIMERHNDFADSIKRRPDVKLIHLQRGNFEQVFRQIKDWITQESSKI